MKLSKDPVANQGGPKGANSAVAARHLELIYLTNPASSVYCRYGYERARRLDTLVVASERHTSEGETHDTPILLEVTLRCPI